MYVCKFICNSMFVCIYKGFIYKASGMCGKLGGNRKMLVAIVTTSITVATLVVVALVAAVVIDNKLTINNNIVYILFCIHQPHI